MKRIITLQDISCVGRCSITVALPVISAMGVECGILPTAVLSNHTMFKNFTCKDLSDQIEPISDMWEKEHITFDGVYTGYLASKEQCAQVVRFFDRFSKCVVILPSGDLKHITGIQVRDCQSMYFPDAGGSSHGGQRETVPRIWRGFSKSHGRGMRESRRDRPQYHRSGSSNWDAV